MRATGKRLIGQLPYNLIDPTSLKVIFTSTRKRALQTKDLLIEHLTETEIDAIQAKVDSDIEEWYYGDYEGLLTKEIQADRVTKQLPGGKDWTIWEYGCSAAGGESSEQVEARVDKFIGKIREIHRKAMEKGEECDVVVVAHGHILRCLTARWIGKPINVNPHYIMDAGGVGVMSYAHHNIDEPAICISGAFLVPVDEEGKGI